MGPKIIPVAKQWFFPALLHAVAELVLRRLRVTQDHVYTRVTATEEVFLAARETGRRARNVYSLDVNARVGPRERKAATPRR